uniref:Uncharacterized protein n=1 Tax=Cyanistes caeruleus TaxID=156563 RepID=A0A8C0VR12_CYACU
MPHIISLCTVMDQDEKPQGHTEGSIKTAKYHIQEMPLRYCERSKGPSGSKQEQSECCGRRNHGAGCLGNGHRVCNVTMAHLHVRAEKVNTGHQHNECHRPVKRTETGLPGHPGHRHLPVPAATPLRSKRNLETCGTHSDHNLATSFLLHIINIRKLHSHFRVGFLEKQSNSKIE